MNAMELASGLRGAPAAHAMARPPTTLGGKRNMCATFEDLQPEKTGTIPIEAIPIKIGIQVVLLSNRVKFNIAPTPVARGGPNILMM